MEEREWPKAEVRTQKAECRSADRNDERCARSVGVQSEAGDVMEVVVSSEHGEVVLKSESGDDQVAHRQ